MNIFSVSEQLATTMQSKGILAQTVMTGVNALKDNLQHQRNDYEFFFNQTRDKADAVNIVEEPSVIKQCLPEVKRVTSMDTVFSVASNGQNSTYLLSNAVRLLQKYLLAPMSAAIAERSFSVQRRIKSYLRSTTTERRYK